MDASGVSNPLLKGMAGDKPRPVGAVDADLAKEPVALDRAQVLGSECLDRNRASVPQVERPVHHGHRARTDLALDEIPSDKCRLQLVHELRHSSPW